jgi:hypothetical protein
MKSFNLLNLNMLSNFIHENNAVTTKFVAVWNEISQ